MKVSDRIKGIWRAPEGMAELAGNIDQLAHDINEDVNHIKRELEDEIEALDDNLSNRPDREEFEKLDTRVEDTVDDLNKLEDRVKEIEEVDIPNVDPILGRLAVLEAKVQILIDAVAMLSIRSESKA